MTSQPKFMGPSAGLTLFEVLISLAILALMAGVVIAGRTGPSPALTLNAKVADVTERAAAIRRDAILQGTDQVWQDDDLACEDQAFEVIYFADGTARGTDICIFVDPSQSRLTVDPLTGTLMAADQ